MKTKIIEAAYHKIRWISLKKPELLTSKTERIKILKIFIAKKIAKSRARMIILFLIFIFGVEKFSTKSKK